MGNRFDVTATKHYCTNYYVQAPSFEDAALFMKDWMNNCLNDRQHYALSIEINPEEKVNLINAKREDSDLIITAIPEENARKGETQEFPYQAKGYDIATESYIFGIVETFQKGEILQAETAEKALEKAKAIYTQEYVVDRNCQPQITVLACSENKAVVLEDGTFVKIHNQEDMVEALREKYPNGMKVLLEDERLDNIIEWSRFNYNSNDELPTLHGLASPNKGEDMLTAVGTLKAELHLHPKDYDLLYADYSTYYTSELLDLDFFDTDVVCTSILMSDKDWEKSFRVEVPLQSKMLNSLFIEGTPYRNLLPIIEANNFKSDIQLKGYLAKQYNEKQDNSLLLMAKDSVAPKLNSYWETHVAPAYDRALQYYLNQVMPLIKKANLNGFDDFMRISIRRDVSKEVEKVRNSFYKGYMPLARVAENRTEEYKLNEEIFIKDYIQNLKDIAKEKISEIRIYPNKQWNYFIRCKIDGVQQSGKPISVKDEKLFAKSGVTKQTMIDSALKYFASEINSIGNERSTQLKR